MLRFGQDEELGHKYFTVEPELVAVPRSSRLAGLRRVSYPSQSKWPLWNLEAAVIGPRVLTPHSLKNLKAWPGAGRLAVLSKGGCGEFQTFHLGSLVASSPLPGCSLNLQFHPFNSPGKCTEPVRKSETAPTSAPGFCLKFKVLIVN